MQRYIIFLLILFSLSAQAQVECVRVLNETTTVGKISKVSALVSAFKYKNGIFPSGIKEEKRILDRIDLDLIARASLSRVEEIVFEAYGKDGNLISLLADRGTRMHAPTDRFFEMITELRKSNRLNEIGSLKVRHVHYFNPHFSPADKRFSFDVRALLDLLKVNIDFDMEIVFSHQGEMKKVGYTLPPTLKIDGGQLPISTADRVNYDLIRQGKIPLTRMFPVFP